MGDTKLVLVPYRRLGGGVIASTYYIIHFSRRLKLLVEDCQSYTSTRAVKSSDTLDPAVGEQLAVRSGATLR